MLHLLVLVFVFVLWRRRNTSSTCALLPREGAAGSSRRRTHIAADHLHPPGVAHGRGVHLLGEVSSLLAGHVGVLELWGDGKRTVRRSAGVGRGRVGASCGTCVVGQLLGPLGPQDVNRVPGGGDLRHLLLALGLVDHLQTEEGRRDVRRAAKLGSSDPSR